MIRLTWSDRFQNGKNSPTFPIPVAETEVSYTLLLHVYWHSYLNKKQNIQKQNTQRPGTYCSNWKPQIVLILQDHKSVQLRVQLHLTLSCKKLVCPFVHVMEMKIDKLISCTWTLNWNGEVRLMKQRQCQCCWPAAKLITQQRDKTTTKIYTEHHCKHVVCCTIKLTPRQFPYFNARMLPHLSNYNATMTAVAMLTANPLVWTGQIGRLGDLGSETSKNQQLSLCRTLGHSKNEIWVRAAVNSFTYLIAGL